MAKSTTARTPIRSTRPAPQRAESDAPQPAPELDGAEMTIGDQPAAEIPRKQKKLTILMSDDGTIEFDRMQPKTREAIVNALKRQRAEFDPGSNATDSEAAAREAAESDEFDRDMIALLYEYTGSILVRWAREKHTEESAATMAFTEAETKRLTEPTLRVMRKWNISIGGKYKDEIVLLGVLGATIQRKASGLKRKPAAVVDFPRAAQAPGAAPGDEPAPAASSSPEQPFIDPLHS